MISIRYRYNTVRRRIDKHKEMKLRASERFVFVFGVIEKKIRRTLVYVWVHNGTGKTVKGAFKYLKRVNSLDGFCQEWANREPHSRDLEELLGASDFAVLREAWDLRDPLFHGEDCAQELTYFRLLRKLIPMLDRMHNKFESEYNYSGWRGLN